MRNSLHDTFGAKSAIHNTKMLSDVMSSESFEKFMKDLEYEKFKIAIVPIEADGRPDMLSYIIYGTPDFWWLLCLINGFQDPYLDIKAGRQIKVLSISQIPAIVNSNIPNTYKSIS